VRVQDQEYETADTRTNTSTRHCEGVMVGHGRSVCNTVYRTDFGAWRRRTAECGHRLRVASYTCSKRRVTDE